MTGGVVVVLGTVGRNVGAGMTGGIGYFYDEDGRFEERVNGEIVKYQRVKTTEGELQLRNIVERHFEKTGSEKAEEILDNWDEELGKFWQVSTTSSVYMIMFMSTFIHSHVLFYSTIKVYPPSEAQSPVVAQSIVGETVKVSARAPSQDLCYLPVGASLNPDQTTRCAD
jgi:glutamate synthase (ferredoxin)